MSTAPGGAMGEAAAAAAGATLDKKGSYVAISTFLPGIEIWDLDVLVSAGHGFRLLRGFGMNAL